eukprot:629859_1
MVDQEKKNESIQYESIFLNKKPKTAKQLSREWMRTVKREMRHLDRTVRKQQQACKKLKAEMKREARRAYGDQHIIKAVRTMAKSYVRAQNEITQIYEYKATFNTIVVELKIYKKYIVSYEDKQLLTMGFFVELRIPAVIVHAITLFYELDYFRRSSPEITAIMDKLHIQKLRMDLDCTRDINTLRAEMESGGLVAPYYPIMCQQTYEPMFDSEEENELDEQVEKIMLELSCTIDNPPPIRKRCSGCGEYGSECSCGRPRTDIESMRRRLAALQ